MVNGPGGTIKSEKTTRAWVRALPYVVLVLGAGVVISACFAFFSSTVRDGSNLNTASSPPSLTDSFWSYSDVSPALTTANTPRDPVYSYSVIPGGVNSAKSLRAALQHDPVAAAHYAGFHVEGARLIRLTSERRAHVSYRMGNQIFWTRKQVTLHAGEALLTDGAHFARTRCGNRLAEVPDGPISPVEPPIDVITQPTFPHPPQLTTDSVPSVPAWSDLATPFLLALAPLSQPVSGGSYPLLPIGPCCGIASKPSTGTQPTPPVSPIPPSAPGPLPQPTPVAPTPPVSPTPPVVATPEPSSILLLTIGLAGILLLKSRRA